MIIDMKLMITRMKNDNANNRINSNKTITNKTFKYKTKMIGGTPNDNNTLNA